MLLTIYILFQIIAISALIYTFMSKTPISSAITAVSSGVIIAGGWVLNIGSQYVYEPSIRSYTLEPILVETSYIPYINLLIFGLAILYFFYDLFVTVQEEAPKVGEKISQKAENNGGFQ